MTNPQLPFPEDRGPRLSRQVALLGLRERPLDFIMEVASRHGDLVRFESPHSPVFFVNHPDLVREVLVSRYQDYSRADQIRRALRLFDGNSILVVEGDQWRQQRRLLQQGFHAHRMRHYAGITNSVTQQVVAKWPASGIISVTEEMSDLCLDVLSQILLGIPMSRDLVGAIRMILDARAAETRIAISSSLSSNAVNAQEREEARAQLQDFLQALIQTRRNTVHDQDDMLTLLVRASQQDIDGGQSQLEADRQIRDEMISMINASLDAMIAAMSWTLYLVARHHAVQTSLREEIKCHARRTEQIDLESVQLPLAERVVWESLRLYPPNWALIPRHCCRDSKLHNQSVPEGSWLFIFPYVLHRDARWFSSPDTFNPDRFLPAALRAPQKSAYIPLGLGPHVCIGKALSTIILTTMLAGILQEYHLELVSDAGEIEYDVDIVLKPTPAMKLKVTRRAVPPTT